MQREMIINFSVIKLEESILINLKIQINQKKMIDIIFNIY